MILERKKYAFKNKKCALSFDNIFCIAVGDYKSTVATCDVQNGFILGC